MSFRNVGLRSVLSLAVLAGLVGCGNSGSSSPSSSSVPQNVKIAWGGQITSLDPQVAENLQDDAVIHLYGANLWRSRGDELKPLLAESSSLSANKLTLTVNLKPGLKFSDGRALTSKDVQASIDRIKVEKKAFFSGLLESVTKIDTPSPTAVVFHLSRPYPSLPTILAEPGFTVLPAAELHNANFYRLPISAGPYKLISWGGGSRTVVLERNPYYAGPAPVVRRLESETVGDTQARLAQLRSGQIDISTDAPPSLLPQLKGIPGVNTHFAPTYGYYYMSSWDQKPPLNEINVRRAIAAAIDRKAISNNVFSGEAPVTKGLWPASMAGYDPSLPEQYDPEKAKQLLKGTSCEKGCALTLKTSSEALQWSDQTTLLLQSDLRKIGINVKIVNLDVQSWVSQTTKDFQLALTGQADFANVPDGITNSGLVLNSGASAGYSGLFMPGATQLTNAVISSEGATRKQLLNQTNAFFLKYQPYYPLVDSGLVFSTRVSLKLIWMEKSQLVEVAANDNVKAAG